MASILPFEHDGADARRALSPEVPIGRLERAAGIAAAVAPPSSCPGLRPSSASWNG